MRNNIHDVSSELENSLKCISKNDLEFRRIKIIAKIPQTDRVLSIVVVSKNKIIVKRIE